MKALGMWSCVALVVGNIVGSGVFLLPASLAPYGIYAVIAWVLTIPCTAFIAAVVWWLAQHLL